MLNDKVETICRYYHRKFKRTKVDVSLNDLRRLAGKEALKAERNYHKIAEPRVCSSATYVSLWIREILECEFSMKALRKVNLKNPIQDSHAQALASLFYFLPLNLIPHLRKEIFDAPFSRRKEIWSGFNLPVKGIENSFRRLVKVRNKEAGEKGYPCLLDYFLEKNKIPKRDYQKFIQKIDRLIISLNRQLPKVNNLPPWFYSEFNLPCFICQLSPFPFHSLDETFDFVAKEYPIIRKFKRKIEIKVVGDTNLSFYKKEKDLFMINIEKGVNVRHRSLSLIHELGHVIAGINSFTKGVDLLFEKGKYVSEKKAIEIEVTLLKKTSDKFYQAILGEVLLFIFRSTLFEIELYQNPDQNLSRLYAKSFNRCFLKAKQKDNPLYILEEHISANPFTYLPHAIAWYKTLCSTI